MRPSFDIMFKSYPRRKEHLREALYESLGWPDLKANPAFRDTCAIRLSVALAGAGVAIRGRLLIKSGPLKGKPVEPGQKALSGILKDKWGAPEIYRSEDEARRLIANRRGVISFFRIDGSPQGHIDLIEPVGNGFHECATSCYFNSLEIWFWELK